MSRLPTGLQKTLEEFTTAAIMKQPEDLDRFGVKYFQERTLGEPEDKRRRVGNDSDDDDDEDLGEDFVPPGFARGKRKSVFAPAPDVSDLMTTSVQKYPKTPAQRERIKSEMSKVFLFRHLQPAELDEVIDSMACKKVASGDMVIKQNDEGDFFYVVEAGLLDVFVDGSHVAEYVGSGYFGELALLHNCPRAASIMAAEPSILWSIGRDVFLHTIMKNGIQQRQAATTYLEGFPLLVDLNPQERASLADALENCTFTDGERIIYQGVEADYFYLVVNGEVKVTKYVENIQREVDITVLGKGNFFGELALLTNKPRAASVWAIGEVQCAKLSRDCFERLLGSCMDVLKRHAGGYEGSLREILDASPATARGYLGLELSTL